MGGVFKSPKVPTPLAPPPAVDQAKAILSGIQYAETQRKLRASTGRKSTFLTAGSTQTTPVGGNVLLGQ